MGGKTGALVPLAFECENVPWTGAAVTRPRTTSAACWAQRRARALRRHHHHHRIHTARSTDLNTQTPIPEWMRFAPIWFAWRRASVSSVSAAWAMWAMVLYRFVLCSTAQALGRRLAAPFDITISKTPPKQTLTERLDCSDDERRRPRSRCMRCRESCVR